MADSKNSEMHNSPYLNPQVSVQRKNSHDLPEKTRPNSFLNVRNLSACIKKNNKTCKILSNISFNIEEGEILGLAGESGCGKSITALSVAGLLPEAVKITEGEIIYKNRNLLLLDENKKHGSDFSGLRGSEISLIFQDVRQALNPLMKAGDQIIETLELEDKLLKRQDKNNKEKVLNILSLLGFENPKKIFNAYPHQLSGGMCQRIMTAMAVIRQPKLLLGDEPSSSLDEDSQNRCMSHLLYLNQKNKMSILLISHDLSIIKEYCSRYIIMYSGRIIEEGPSSSLLSPQTALTGEKVFSGSAAVHHPYTKALISAIPDKDKRGKKLPIINGKTPSVEDEITGCPFAPRCPQAKNICEEVFPPEQIINRQKIHCYFPDI